ncbi:MAG: hypothetical protein O2923_10935 [Verrucomicrobia bacterium]|nr:hypothetical protein [Verrucomicrobiota bacterium]MDA1088169.1 hypothetical protein [Verrucomicrobiota bacterium]
MISHSDYKLKDADSVPTPAMLVFEDIVDQNIRALCDLSGAANVCPHVKTHKSVAVTRRQLAAGITVFKCTTLRELEMVLEAGVCDAGFHRTGVEPGQRAMELYRLADADANLTAAGLSRSPGKVLP